MAKTSRSVPDPLAEFTALFERQEAGEARLAQARDGDPLAFAVVMAAQVWNRLDPQGWHGRSLLAEQARRLVAAGRVGSVPASDDAVDAALRWAVRAPALLERDGHGRYRPPFALVGSVGEDLWRRFHRAAVTAGTLTPLEVVVRGDAERDADPADPAAAERLYGVAASGDDPDAAALAGLRLAELADHGDRSDHGDQAVVAARRFAEVAALRHPVASPPALLWLARRAVADGNAGTACALAREVTGAGHDALVPRAWDLLAGLAWLDGDRAAAVRAQRAAVAAGGQWHAPYTRRLAAMLTECGDLPGAADVYVTLLDIPLFHPADAGQYAQLMAAAGRTDEAVAVLERHVAQDGPFTAHLLLALASAHAADDNVDAVWRTLNRVRTHPTASMPLVSVPADIMEATVAAAVGDDVRAAALFRSVTDTDDTHRRDIARPLLIAAGRRFADDGKVCLVPGIRPLLEYLCESAPPDIATWAATSLAHLATVDGRRDDAEAAVRLAARHLAADEVTLLRARLLRRAGRDRDAVAYLVDACAGASPSALASLLPAIARLASYGVRPDARQRGRLRGLADHALCLDDPDRYRLAAAVAQLELKAWLEHDRAVELWELAADSTDPTVAASAYLNIGLVRQYTAPVAAAQALRQAMLAPDPAIAVRAADQLLWLAQRIGDHDLTGRACERLLDVGQGDERARACLHLGRLHQYRHPDDAEDAYHAALAEPGIAPATTGAVLARLGALYALHGNRRIAQRMWRRGRRHRDPDVARAFAAERKAVGRVTRIRPDNWYELKRRSSAVSACRS